MKHTLFFISLVVFIGNTFSQRDYPSISEGIRQQWYNPASVATYNKLGVHAVYQNQAPNLSLNRTDIRIGAEGQISIGDGWKTRKAEIGLGGFYKRSNIYYINSDYFNLQANFKLKLGENYASVGWQTGYYIQRVDEDLLLGDIAPSIYDQSMEGWRNGLGIQWYGERFLISGAITSLIDVNNSDVIRSHPLYYLHGSYTFKFGDKINSKVMGTVRANDWNNGYFSLMTYTGHKAIPLFLGVGVHDRGFAYGAYGRFKNFQLGYYGWVNNSPLNNYSGAPIHELRLAYEISNKSLVQHVLPF